MVEFSLRPAHAQKHGFELTPNIITTQELSCSHHHQIEQRIIHEMSQNPALELDNESDVFEEMEPEERDDDWDEGYDKPIDEYETGDSSTSQETETWDYFDISANLEQAATQRFIDHPDQLEQALQHVDYYRIHGCLPDDVDPQLHEDLAELENSTSYQTLPSIYPTFEVMVEGDRVEANVVPIGQNLTHVQGLGPSSTSAKNFIKLLHERNRLLNDLAYYILEILQGDFFRQHDFDIALRYLLTVPIKELSKLPINSPFKFDEKYFSKFGDHLVSCSFGIFPLNFFLQKKAQIVRLWVHFAEKEKRVTKKEQLYWIRTQIGMRVEKWDFSDVRHKFVSPLKRITIDDIKYARRKNKQAIDAPKNQFG